MNLLQPRTIAFLLRESEILLGFKKRGFGKDYLVGIGGGVEPGETIEEAAQREVMEEIYVRPLELHPVGVINFYFPHIEDGSWDLQAHVFTTTSWTGEPQESEEIKPAWFQRQAIPYEKMWDDARYWLPYILDGQRIEAAFVFNSDLKVVRPTITPL